MFAYQGDGLFIVSCLDVPPPFPFGLEPGNELNILS